jgi:flagellar biogenesis protein FliO
MPENAAKPVAAAPAVPSQVTPATETPSAAPSSPATPDGEAAAAAPASSFEHRPIRPVAVAKAGEESAPSNASPAGEKSSGVLSGMGNLGQVAAALSIVIGLILIGRVLVRKFVPGAKASSGRGVIEILARHPLCKNQSLVLVRIGSQIVALNQGKDASQSVLVVNDATEVASIIGQIEGRSPKSIQAGFNRLLANAQVDLEQNAPPPGETEMDPQDLDEQLEEMAAAKRQLMELRQHVRSVRDSLPKS